ncbi:ABC transporter substrate-binding protein [Methylobacterium sp. A54F]
MIRPLWVRLHWVRPFGLLAALLAAVPAAARPVTDAAGRTVAVPGTVARVLPAGPPASVLLYTLAPGKMAGWVRAPSPAEAALLAAPARDLPGYGRLTGRGGTANVEAVLAAAPDLVLDVGSTGPTYASLADRVQAQTGIPYLLLDGTFAGLPETYRRLGAILGVEARAGELADDAAATIAEIAARVATVPEARRPRVYYGRGPKGLETGLAGSINVEILEAAGARNVAAAAGTGGLAAVSPEQVLAWDPEVILTVDPAVQAAFRTDPLWSGVAAVRANRVYRAPALPFGWFDAPPGVNRLIGLRWLAKLLYPDLFPEPLGATVRTFYRRYYHVDLSEAQLAALLDGTGTAP